MGLEADGVLHYQGESHPGRAHFEEKEIVFRGGVRLAVPLSELSHFEHRGPNLILVFGKGQEAHFELGRKKAEKWYLKIRYPRNLMDKLGIKPGLRVSVLGVKDESFWTMLRDRTADIAEDSPAEKSDLILLQCENVHELDRLKTLEPFLKRNGGIWGIWPKGQPHIKENDIRSAGRKCGLVDVKVVSFSQRLSGLKLVIPVSRR